MLGLSLDWRILTFTALVAVATAGIFGMVPALRATRGAPVDVLKMQGRAASQDTAGAGRFFTLSSGLVIVQIALSLALVIAAALFVRSFARLSHVPLGFDPDRVLVVNVDMQRAHTNLADRTFLYQRIVDAAASVPGVAHAGGSIWTPVDGGMRMGDSQSRVEFNFVTPGWFAAYGTTVRSGRDFTVRDTAGAAPVVVVNEAFARALRPGRSPVGETIPYPRSREGEVQRTIVGVVGDTVFDSQREGIQPIVYLPVAQAGIEPGNLTEISVGVRPAAGSPLQIARSVGAAIIGVSVRRERIVAVLSELFGALALVIAALGLYGVTSYTVNRRFSEIGIRMALGAQRTQVFGLVLGHSLTLTSVGIGLGLAGATATTQYVRGMLFGITPLDPSTFIAVAVIFAIVAAVAAAIPAHRATKVDPLVALRTD
jgi:predicted permease